MCLDSIKESCKSKIIVAHNGNNPSPNLTDDGRTTVFSIPFQQGQWHALNEAIKWNVASPWILIINDDMVVSPNWLKELMFWVEKQNLLVASPNLVEPRRGAPPFLEHFCGGVGTVGAKPDFDEKCFTDFVESYSPLEQSSYSGKTPVEDGLNLPILIRKDVWDTIGGADEQFDPWGSNGDSDLQYRIMYAGITPKRIKSSLVYHFSQTSGTFHPDNAKYVQENHKKFTDKWGVVRASSPEIWYKPDVDFSKTKFQAEWKGKFENHN
jgi:GT2 family glycosyltransferase